MARGVHRDRATIRGRQMPACDMDPACVESPDGAHCDHWHYGDACGCCYCGSGATDDDVTALDGMGGAGVMPGT